MVWVPLIGSKVLTRTPLLIQYESGSCKKQKSDQMSLKVRKCYTIAGVISVLILALQQGFRSLMEGLKCCKFRIRVWIYSECLSLIQCFPVQGYFTIKEIDLASLSLISVIEWDI